MNDPFLVVAGLILILLIIFAKPLLLGAAAAGSGLLVALLIASKLWSWRQDQALRRLRCYGSVEFTPGLLTWTKNAAPPPDASSLIIPVSLMIGGFVPGAAIKIMADRELFGAAFQFGADFSPQVAWWGTAAAAFVIYCGGGGFLLRRLQQRWQRKTLALASRQWEEIAGEAAPVLARLAAITGEITRLREIVGLPIGDDYASKISALFQSAAAWHPRQSDRSLVRKTLADAEDLLAREKQDLAAAVSQYWEAMAALAEADIAIAQAEAADKKLFLRLKGLRERLFSPGLMELLNTCGSSQDGHATDYQNITAAIYKEAQALAETARSGREGEKESPRASGSNTGEAEAYALLGSDPKAGGEEIVRLYAGLMALWAGEDSDSKARRQELTRAYAVLQRKEIPDEQGPAVAGA